MTNAQAQAEILRNLKVRATLEEETENGPKYPTVGVYFNPGYNYNGAHWMRGTDWEDCLSEMGNVVVCPMDCDCRG